MVDDGLEWGTTGSEWSLQQSRYQTCIWLLVTEMEREREISPRQEALCPLSSRTLKVFKLQGRIHCIGNSPMSPSWFQRHLCWRPLSSPSLAPAFFLRKLGSPWERVCPWGRALGSVPYRSADIRGGPKRGSAPPACTCASPGGRERLRGGVQEEGEGEARQNLGPGRPGRPRRSCSLQQVRRTRARSLLLSRHLLRWSRFAGETLAIGPALRSSLRAASSLLPSPGSSQPPPALPGRGEGRRGSFSLQHRPGDSSRSRRGPLPGQHCTGGQRPPGRLLSSLGPGSVPRPGRRGQSLSPAGSAPRVSTAAADSSCRQPASPRAANKAEGLGPPTLFGSGWLHPWGISASPRAVSGRAGEGGLVTTARLWLGSAVRKAWPCNGGSQLEVRKRVGGETGSEGSRAPVGRAGPRLERRNAPPPLPSRPLPPP